MRLALALLVLALPCLATDYFVAPSGNDANPCSLASPCRTIQQGQNTASAGDTVWLRVGRYTSTGVFLTPTKSGTTSQPIAFKAYPGEAVIFDGENSLRQDGGTKRFLVATPSNTYGSHFHFYGLRFEGWNWLTWPILLQGQHPGLQFHGCYFALNTGAIILNPNYDGTGVRIMGSNFQLGVGASCQVNDTGADDDYSGSCPVGTTMLLLSTTTPNTGACTLDINDGTGPHEIYDGAGPPANGVLAGSGHITYLFWYNSRWNRLGAGAFDCSAGTGSVNGVYTGCDDFIIQATKFNRRGSGSDFVATEASDGGSVANGRILLSNVDIVSTQALNDCLDLKSSGVTVEWTRVIGCGAKGFGIWGYIQGRNIASDGPSFFGAEYSSRIISNVVDDGGFMKVTAYYNPYGGQVPMVGHRVAIAGVNGCTNSNGTWRIKDAVNKDTFRIMSDAGTGGTCNAPFSSSPSSSIRIAPPASGVSGDIKYMSIQRDGSLPGLWNTGSTQPHPARAYNMILSNLNSGTGYGFCIGKDSIRYSGNNQFYSARGQVYDLDYANNCVYHSGHLLSTYEPDSHHGAPNLDQATFRATASSPATLVNRGFWAGTDTAEVGSTRMTVRFRSPSPTGSCTVDLDDNSNFSSLVETISSTVGAAWREVTFGLTTPLVSATQYYWRITCDYDVFTGQATTITAPAETRTASFSIGPATGQSKVAVDYSTDKTNWTNGTATSCLSGCTVSVSSLTAGQVYYFRSRILDGSDNTLATSPPWSGVI